MKTKIRQILLLAAAMFGLAAGAQAQTPYTITTNTIWDSSTVPSAPIGNVIISPGVTLTIDNCIVKMGTSASIVLQNNATLLLDNAQLIAYNNGYLWDGIVLRGICFLEIHESRIECAKIGVKHVSGQSTIKIEDSYFYNCAEGIEFNYYPYNGNSYITNTNFEITKYDISNNIDFNNNYNNTMGVSFSCHISAHNSYVPVISGCEFVNNNNSINGYDYAIKSVKSEIRVQESNNTMSSFSRFNCAINTVDSNFYELFVNNTYFEGNVTSIRSLYAKHIEISYCELSLGGFDDANFPYREGIVLNNCKSYEIYRNILYKESPCNILGSTGIYIKNLDGLNGNICSIYENMVNGIQYGIHTTGNNLSDTLPGSTVGLDILCNEISDCVYGIYNHGQIGEPQGSIYASAGNVFNDNWYDIYNFSLPNITYYYDGLAPIFHNVNIIETSEIGCQYREVVPKDTIFYTRKGKHDMFEFSGNTTLETLEERYYDRNDKVEPDTKQPTFGAGDFPLTCSVCYVDPTVCSPIYSNELKFVFEPHNICSISGDTVFVQGEYTPAINEYPEDASMQWYWFYYSGSFSFKIYYSDSSLSAYDSGLERCLTDKQCMDMNLQISVESDFATGKHYATRCAEIETYVDGHQAFVNTNDTLGAFSVKQLPELVTPTHDYGEGTVTISWTGFDGTPRQHVLYFIIDDHFYIDYVGLDENEEEPSMTRLRVYPNPTEGMFTIEADDITAVEVFDQLGQKVLTDHSGSQTVNATALPAGVYLLKVETATGTKYGKLMRK